MSDFADNLIDNFSTASRNVQKARSTSNLELFSEAWNSLSGYIEELESRIAELEAENAELKPYRDGYDACENFPEEGVNVIAARGNWFFLAQRRGDKWYDSLGQQAEIRGGIERWWKLPEVQE